jgi:hypothetical protein
MAVLGLVVVAPFSIEVGWPVAVIQPTTDLGGVAAGENRASTLVVADNVGVFSCHYLNEGIVFVAPIP